MKSEDEEVLNDIISTFLRFADRDGASAILFEPQSDQLLIYHFIRGEKKLEHKLPFYIYAPLVKRLREMAGLGVLPSDELVQAEEGLVQVRMRDQRHGLHMNHDLHITITSTSTGSELLITFQSTD